MVWYIKEILKNVGSFFSSTSFLEEQGLMFDLAQMMHENFANLILGEFLKITQKVPPLSFFGMYR